MMYGLPGFANLADTTSQRGGGEESNGTTLEAQLGNFFKSCILPA